MKVPPVTRFFQVLGHGMEKIEHFAFQGASFVYGGVAVQKNDGSIGNYLSGGFVFAFNVTATIILVAHSLLSSIILELCSVLLQARVGRPRVEHARPQLLRQARGDPAARVASASPRRRSALAGRGGARRIDVRQPGRAGVPASSPGAHDPEERLPRLVSLRTVALEWTRIGVTGFGGPPAHIALLRRLVVQRRQWIGARDFEDAIAACNLLPGPASTQLAIFCAYRLAARWGRWSADSASSSRAS